VEEPLHPFIILEVASRRSEYGSAVAEAFLASAADGLIVDIRSQDARKLHGVVPGSVHIPRTVLEWRHGPGPLDMLPGTGPPE
jgi:hypothetical protein